MLPVHVVLLVMMFDSHLADVNNYDTDADAHVCRLIISNSVIIQGISRRMNNESRYCSFLAIPYAWPPINELRFQQPILYPLEQINVKGTYDQEPNWCLQAIILYANRLLVGTEDCLYLNVFMSERISRQLAINNDGDENIDASPLHPVVVWIHGGSFNYGKFGNNTTTTDTVINI